MARAAVAAAVGVHAYGKREVVVRVNGLDTPWIARDIAAIVAAMPDAVLIPKISRPEDIRRARAALHAAQAPEGLALWAMIETPLAVLNAGGNRRHGELEFRRAARGAGDRHQRPHPRDRDALRRRPLSLVPALVQCVLAARAYGIAVLDGTFNDLNQLGGLPRRVPAGPRPRHGRQDPDPSAPGRRSPTRCSRRAPTR